MEYNPQHQKLYTLEHLKVRNMHDHAELCILHIIEWFLKTVRAFWQVVFSFTFVSSSQLPVPVFEISALLACFLVLLNIPGTFDIS